ncbi:hydrogenase iron-sulfur subunit [Chloroflexota bacterium]
MYPKILVFSCNWDGWSCIEAATESGLHYPTSVRLVRVSCLSRVHAGLILKAFEFGAEGVMLLGCQPDSCHFDSDNECISREYEKARDILEVLGILKDRLTLVQLPAFDGHQFVSQVMKFLAKLKQIPASKQVRVASSKVNFSI